MESKVSQTEIGDGDIPKEDDLDEDYVRENEEDSDMDEEDKIVPMGHSKRKRIILDDEDDEEIPKEKKSNSPVKSSSEEGVTSASDTVSVSDDLSTCTYCPAKVLKADLKAHMSKEHAWLDTEIDDNVTYESNVDDDVDYDDVEVDYDEEGDDFFEDDGNLEERPVVASNILVTEECDFCDEKIEISRMNEHLLKQHDINMTEGSDFTSTDKPNSTDMSVSPCPICKTLIATAILPIHISYYHADLAKQEPVVPQKETKDVVEEPGFGDQCEMCDEKMPTNKIASHLLEVHDIKVIDDNLEESSEIDDSGNPTVGVEDPFDIPDFLIEKPKPKPKFKCHHCQKKFSTREKVDIHVNKRHDKRCQVCVTYKLVQENRYIGIMKQLNKTAKGLKDDTLPASDNNITGQVEDIVYNYEDLYPEEEYEECEECEDDFYWRNKEHACDLTMANVRILSGKKFNCGDPDEEGDENVNGEEIFEYITNRLAKSFVDRASKDATTSYVRNIVDDIVEVALNNKQFNPSSHSGPPVSQYIRQKEIKEDQNLQLKSQILAYKYLKRKEKLPNIVERAASYENFRDSPRDDIRKLNDYFYKEYKEDIEKEEKEKYEKKVEEKKKAQEEVLREMNTNKLYDYSKYFIPTMKPPKKPRKIQPKKEQKTPLLDSMMNNSMDNSGFKLPSGTALQMNDRNYLNNLKKQQEKTVKKLQSQGNDRNSKQYQDTMRELEVENKRLQSFNQAPNFRNPFRPNQVKQEPTIKLEPGSLGKAAPSAFGNMPGISIKRVEPPQPPKLEIKKESPALQRLQSLGLSISVGQNGQTRPLEPAKPRVEPGMNRTYPGPSQQKPGPVLNSSVLEQYRQMAGIKKLEAEPVQPSKPQSLWNASAKGREPQQPARNQMPQPREALQPLKSHQPFREPQQPGRNNLSQNRQPQNSVLNREPVRQLQNSEANREPVRDTFKKPASRTYDSQRQQQSPQNIQPKSYPPQNRPQPPKPFAPPLQNRHQPPKSSTPAPQNRPQPPRPVPERKAEYTDSQKLQLKSQILAYRMVSRKERLPQIVKLAASNTNLKSMNIPKNEMRSLSNFFRQEYSAIA
eukprot:GFUD01026917.1.p1 GENE.GFUD01026917.1~~GFUD01026917.1.p1  ORF type:complete len:1084 (-),score=315.06 GFUD01026917.1:45-3296(-)